jgi:hypothetical protein
MKRTPKTANGQFTLLLHREPSPQLDRQRKEEVLKALADLMLEALRAESTMNQEDQKPKEERDESKDHA